MNKQAVPKNITETIASSNRKISLELRMDNETAPRKNSMAANANEGEAEYTPLI
jgi:hypothetical protein